MLAEAVPQRLVQQVRHRMVGAQPAPALAVDPQFDRVADLQLAVPHRAEMQVQLAGLLLRVAHRQFAAGGREDRAGVADLAAAIRRRTASG